VEVRNESATNGPYALSNHEEGAMSHQQLTLDERYQIQASKRLGMSNAAIARQLHRHPSTIGRELRRNVTLDIPYGARKAARMAHQRRIDKGERSRKIQGKVQTQIEKLLRQGWSPEQISGRFRRERRRGRVCHETIYQHVIRDSRRGGQLRYALRFGGYQQHRFKKSKVGERTRMRRHRLEHRPTAANNRTELGHWERDCVLGRRGGAALLTMIDRKSRYTRVQRIRAVTTKEAEAATIKALAPYRDITKTITNDNGVEFQMDQSLENKLGIPVYYCDPSSPWQRGSIENANGLIRQYVPKHTPIELFPKGLETALEETLNHRPRKVLGYRTPHEVFFKNRVRMLSNQRLQIGLEFSGST